MSDPFASSSSFIPFIEWTSNENEQENPSAQTRSSVDPFAHSSSSNAEDAFASADGNHSIASIDDVFASVKEFQSLSNSHSSPFSQARAIESHPSTAPQPSKAVSTPSSLPFPLTGITAELPFVPVVGPILPDSDEYLSRLEKKLLKLHSKPLETRQQPQRQVAGSEFFVTTSSSTSSSSSFFPSSRSNDRHFSSATSSWLDDDNDDDSEKEADANKQASTSANDQKDSLDSKESNGGYHSSEDESELGGPARTIQWMEDQFALLDNFEQQLDEEHMTQMTEDIRATDEGTTAVVNSAPFSQLVDELAKPSTAGTISSTSATSQQPRVIEIESSDADLSGAPRHVQSLDQPNALYPPSSGHSVISTSTSVSTPPTTYLGYLSHRHLYYQSQLYMAQASVRTASLQSHVLGASAMNNTQLFLPSQQPHMLTKDPLAPSMHIPVIAGRLPSSSASSSVFVSSPSSAFTSSPSPTSISTPLRPGQAVVVLPSSHPNSISTLANPPTHLTQAETHHKAAQIQVNPHHSLAASISLRSNPSPNDSQIYSTAATTTTPSPSTGFQSSSTHNDKMNYNNNNNTKTYTDHNNSSSTSSSSSHSGSMYGRNAKSASASSLPTYCIVELAPRLTLCCLIRTVDAPTIKKKPKHADAPDAPTSADKKFVQGLLCMREVQSKLLDSLPQYKGRSEQSSRSSIRQELEKLHYQPVVASGPEITLLKQRKIIKHNAPGTSLYTVKQVVKFLAYHSMERNAKQLQEMFTAWLKQRGLDSFDAVEQNLNPHPNNAYHEQQHRVVGHALKKKVLASAAASANGGGGLPLNRKRNAGTARIKNEEYEEEHEEEEVEDDADAVEYTGEDEEQHAYQYSRSVQSKNRGGFLSPGNGSNSSNGLLAAAAALASGKLKPSPMKKRKVVREEGDDEVEGGEAWESGDGSNSKEEYESSPIDPLQHSMVQQMSPEAAYYAAQAAHQQQQQQQQQHQQQSALAAAALLGSPNPYLPTPTLSPTSGMPLSININMNMPMNTYPHQKPANGRPAAPVGVTSIPPGNVSNTLRRGNATPATNQTWIPSNSPQPTPPPPFTPFMQHPHYPLTPLQQQQMPPYQQSYSFTPHSAGHQPIHSPMGMPSGMMYEDPQRLWAEEAARAQAQQHAAAAHHHAAAVHAHAQHQAAQHAAQAHAHAQQQAHAHAQAQAAAAAAAQGLMNQARRPPVTPAFNLVTGSPQTSPVHQVGFAGPGTTPSNLAGTLPPPLNPLKLMGSPPPMQVTPSPLAHTGTAMQHNTILGESAGMMALGCGARISPVSPASPLSAMTGGLFSPYPTGGDGTHANTLQVPAPLTKRKGSNAVASPVVTSAVEPVSPTTNSSPIPTSSASSVAMSSSASMPSAKTSPTSATSFTTTTFSTAVNQNQQGGSTHTSPAVIPVRVPGLPLHPASPTPPTRVKAENGSVSPTTVPPMSGGSSSPSYHTSMSTSSSNQNGFTTVTDGKHSPHDVGTLASLLTAVSSHDPK